MNKLIILALLMVLLVGCTNEEITTVLKRDQSITIDTTNNKYEYKNKLDKKPIKGVIETRGVGNNIKINHKTLWGLLGDNTEDTDEKLYTGLQQIKERGYFVDWEDDKVTLSQTKNNEMAALPYKQIECSEFDVKEFSNQEYRIKHKDYSTQMIIVSDKNKVIIDKVIANYQGEFIVIIKEVPNDKTLPSCLLVERHIGGRTAVKTEEGVEFYWNY